MFILKIMESRTHFTGFTRCSGLTGFIMFLLKIMKSCTHSTAGQRDVKYHHALRAHPEILA